MRELGKKKGWSQAKEGARVETRRRRPARSRPVHRTRLSPLVQEDKITFEMSLDDDINKEEVRRHFPPHLARDPFQPPSPLCPPALYLFPSLSPCLSPGPSPPVSSPFSLVLIVWTPWSYLHHPRWGHPSTSSAGVSTSPPSPLLSFLLLFFPLLDAGRFPL